MKCYILQLSVLSPLKITFQCVINLSDTVRFHEKFENVLIIATVRLLKKIDRSLIE